MKTLIESYDYLYYLLYSVARRIYSKKLSPEFYAAHALIIIITFGPMPLLVRIHNIVGIGDAYTIYELLALGAVLYYINLKRFKIEKAEELYKFFQGRKNAVNQMILGLFVVVMVVIWMTMT